MSIIKRGDTGVQVFNAVDIGAAFPPVVGSSPALALPQQWNVITIVAPATVTSSSGTFAGAKLPPDSDTEIGDVMEIYTAGPAGGSLFIFDDAGSEFSGITVNNNTTAFVFRKIAANTWKTMSQG